MFAGISVKINLRLPGHAAQISTDNPNPTMVYFSCVLPNEAREFFLPPDKTSLSRIHESFMYFQLFVLRTLLCILNQRVHASNSRRIKLQKHTTGCSPFSTSTVDQSKPKPTPLAWTTSTAHRTVGPTQKLIYSAKAARTRLSDAPCVADYTAQRPHRRRVES